MAQANQKQVMQKQAASPIADAVGAGLWDSVTGGTNTLVGSIAKYLPVASSADAEAKKARERSVMYNAIPFLSGYNSGKHLAILGKKEQEKGVKNPTSHMLSEDIGTFTGVGTGAGAGAGAAALISKLKGLPNTMGSAAGGGMIAGSATILTALAAALIAKRRSVKEQVKHDKNDSRIGNYLTPGQGLYNALKRFGAAQQLSNDNK
jgi:hypothetical protein